MTRHSPILSTFVALRLQVFHTRSHATGVFRQESSLDDETLGDPMCNSHSRLRSVLRVFSQVAQKTPPLRSGDHACRDSENSRA
jgi:hypothetical protein